jgi:hypothetical protein
MNIDSKNIKTFIEIDSLSFMIEYITGEIINYYYSDITINNKKYENFNSLPQTD